MLNEPSTARGGQRPDGRFSRIYARVFRAALVLFLGGGIGGLLVGFQASLAIDRLRHPPILQGYSSPQDFANPRHSIYRVLYDLGLTQMWELFAVGAVVGIALAALYLKAGGKVTILVCVLASIGLLLWSRLT